MHSSYSFLNYKKNSEIIQQINLMDEKKDMFLTLLS